jgi:hypothetical protein
MGPPGNALATMAPPAEQQANALSGMALPQGPAPFQYATSMQQDVTPFLNPNTGRNALAMMRG